MTDSVPETTGLKSFRVVALIFLAMFAPSVLAVLILVRSGSSGSSTEYLRYGNGSVLGNVSTYAIFWLPRGQHFEPGGNDRRYEGLMEQLLRGLSGSSYYNVLAQYADNAFSFSQQRTTAFRAGTIDTHPLPTRVARERRLTPPDVQGELRRVIKAQRWPAGLHSVFLLFVPDGLITCPEGAGRLCDDRANSWCGTHGYLPQAAGDVIYVTLPVAQRFCSRTAGPAPTGDRTADAETLALSRQLLDAVLNPGGAGWVDRHGEEIADKCRYAPGVPDQRDSGAALVTLHGSRYVVAQLWSNAVGHCVAG